ncbi:GNAT family N-acetyltransferase [Bacteroidota bacterium]
MELLENDLIKLRAPELSDLELLYAWENDTEVWPASNTLAPFSKHVLRKYLDNAHEDIYQAKQLRLMIDIKGEDGISYKTIGAIDLFNFDPFHHRAGLGVLIGRKELRGKGFASQALKLVIDYAFGWLGLHQLYCNISHDNTISLKLFKTHGFEVIGEKKDWVYDGEKWHSEYLLQLINE